MKWLLVWLCVCACGLLHGETIRLLNGEVMEGRVDFGARGITVTKGTGPTVPVDLAAILEISFRQMPESAKETLPPGVLLTSGSVIPELNLPALDAAAITVGVERVQVPTASIAWLLFNRIAPAKLEAVPAGQPGGLLEGGDFFPGTMVGFKGGRVMLNSVLFGPQGFTPKTQIEAVCLREWKPSPARFVVTTIPKSRFVTDDLRVEAGVITVKDSVLGVLRFKVEQLESLRAGPGRYQALAEQKPAKVETRPGTDAATTLQIQKGGAESPDVITIAPNLAVTYSVPPEFTTLTTSVSVPKAANPAARVAFAVYGDGRPLLRTQLLSVNDKPVPVRIDLRGVRAVALRVEPSGAATTGGEWSAPMLLR